MMLTEEQCRTQYDRALSQARTTATQEARAAAQHEADTLSTCISLYERLRHQLVTR